MTVRWRLAGVIAAALLAGFAMLLVRPPASPRARVAFSEMEVREAGDLAKERQVPDHLMVAPKPDGTVLLPEAESLARELNTTGHTAEEDLQTLHTLVGLFKRANQGAIPDGGLNEEFVAAMLGRNPQHFAVLPADCPGLAANGELLDRWGTPYFMHPLSRDLLEIRSAGPDRKMFTEDDIQLHDEAGAGIKR